MVATQTAPFVPGNLENDELIERAIGPLRSLCPNLTLDAAQDCLAALDMLKKRQAVDAVIDVFTRTGHLSVLEPALDYIIEAASYVQLVPVLRTLHDAFHAPFDAGGSDPQLERFARVANVFRSRGWCLSNIFQPHEVERMRETCERWHVHLRI